MEMDMQMEMVTTARRGIDHGDSEVMELIGRQVRDWDRSKFKT